MMHVRALTVSVDRWGCPQDVAASHGGNERCGKHGTD